MYSRAGNKKPWQVTRSTRTQRVADLVREWLIAQDDACRAARQARRARALPASGATPAALEHSFIAVHICSSRIQRVRCCRDERSSAGLYLVVRVSKPRVDIEFVIEHAVRV